MIAQPGFERRPDLSRRRGVQIISDGVELTVRATRSTGRDHDADLVRLQPRIVIEVEPSIDGPGQGMRIAEPQVVQRESWSITRVAAHQRQPSIRTNTPRSAHCG